MIHTIKPDITHFHGQFSRERVPILTIASGDTIVCQTLDAAWGLDPFAEDPMHSTIKRSERRDPEHDYGHCLVGPIAVRGAEPGMTLEVEVRALRPASVGATWAAE